MGRSKNPDLIFDDVLLERAERVAEHYSKEDFHGIRSSSVDLDRVTLFVTHRCNLFCEYCNGPHINKSMDPDERKEMLSADMTLEQYTALLEDWSKHNLRHIHFTGGEATLNPYLLDFVKLANERGILSSLTTNGTADIQLYRNLVDNGLTEIRISLDSAVDEEFDALVGIRGTCRKVKENIRALVDMRDDEGKDLFIVLNACVGGFNVDRIKSTIQPLAELNPDDIKFLVVAEQGKAVCSKSSRDVVNELLAYAHDAGKDYELLEKKIHRLFRRSTFGLSDPTAQHEIHQCFIPLTERTLDARGFYPCSIYLRYKGALLMDINAGFKDQQIAINHFVETHDCRDDAICEYNCTNCCKEFNIAVNRKVRKQIALQKAHEQGAIEVDKPSAEEVNEVVVAYRAIKELTPSYSFPFMIIKPQGLEHEDEIKAHLKSQGIVILKEISIPDWQRYSLFLYFKDAEGKRAEFRIARNKSYAHFEPKNSALFLLLEEGIPEKKLFRIKHELRNWYGEDIGFFMYDGKECLLRSNCVHVPNYRDLETEHKVAKYFLE